ncbi:hypothetical protein V6O07_07105, partial [Arthrospira platensis SPKY2]
MLTLTRQPHHPQQLNAAGCGSVGDGHRWRRVAVRFVFIGLVALSLGACGGGSVSVDGPFVLATTIDGPITPVIAG